MKLIVGLGNPETKYAHTKHNIGYEVIDTFNLRYGDLLNSNLSNLTTHKPQDGMNSSGNSTGELVRRLAVFNQDVIVVFDDMDLPLGAIKIKKVKSSTHNGVKSIIETIGTDFIGVKVGIGKPADKSKVFEYVLSDFEANVFDIVNEVIEKATEAVKCILDEGLDKAMNLYNRSK